MEDNFLITERFGAINEPIFPQDLYTTNSRSNILNNSKHKQKYIEDIFRIFKLRLDEHRGYVKNKDKGQGRGAHFNLPGHILANLKATVIEQITRTDKAYKKDIFHQYIQ